MTKKKTEATTKKIVPETIRHNKGIVIAIFTFLVFAGCVFGLASKVPSIVNEDKKVTRPELRAEVEVETARLKAELQRIKALAKTRNEELDRQDKIKQDIVDIGLVVAEGGNVNPIGILGYALGLFGVGATIDNRLKDTVIKKKEAEK